MAPWSGPTWLVISMARLRSFFPFRPVAVVAEPSAAFAALSFARNA